MALTQVNTKGITDATVATADLANDAVTAAKIADNAIENNQLADGEITHNKLASNSVTSAKIVDDAVVQAAVADEAINEARLQISNAGTNGQYLQKQSGNTGGLTWADVPAGVGGATGLDVNDSVKIRLGTGNDLEIYHDGSNSYLKNSTGNLSITNTGNNTIINSDNITFQSGDQGETIARFLDDGACELWYDNSKKLETISTGVTITGNLGIGTTSPTFTSGGGVHLKGSGTDFTSFRVTASSNTGFDISQDSNANGFLYVRDSADLIVGTNNTERLRILNTGKVGIGTASPSHALHVESDASGVIAAKQTTNNGGYNTFEGKDSSGNVKFYASHNGRVGASEGIIFGSDTAAENILDDYEEGTWTATVTGSTSGSGTPSGVYKYVKVGKLCTATVRVNGQTFPTISGQFRMSLPFTSMGGTNFAQYGSSVYYYPQASFDPGDDWAGLTAVVDPSTAYFRLMVEWVDGDRQGALGDMMSADSGIHFNATITYQTA